MNALLLWALLVVLAGLTVVWIGLRDEPDHSDCIPSYWLEPCEDEPDHPDTAYDERDVDSSRHDYTARRPR